MKQSHHKKRKYFLISIALLLALALAVTILLPYAVDINNYRGFIIQQAEELLNRRVSIKEIQLHLINGIGIRCIGVVIGDVSGQGKFIWADDVLVKFKPIPLLKKELVINKIILDHPQINIERDTEGRFSFQPPQAVPEEEKKGEEEGIEWSLSRLLIDKIIIRQGRARLIDWAVDEQGLTSRVEELNLTLRAFELGQPFALKLTAKLDQGENRASYIALSAKVSGLDRGVIDPAQISLRAQAKINDWNLSAFRAYYKDRLPWESLAGLADIELDYEGNLADDFQLQARLDFKSAWLAYPKLFPTPLPLEGSQAQLVASLKGNRLDTQIKHFKLNCGRFNITGQLGLADLLSDQASISLQADCSPFAIEAGKRYIPFEVIPPKLADFINNGVSSGMVEDLSVKLAGELSRFKQLNKPENYAVLSASAKFKNLNLALADYKFEGISGLVELSEGILRADELSGRLKNNQLKIYNSQIANLYSAPQFELHLVSALSLAEDYLKQSLPAFLKEGLNSQGQATLRLEARGESADLAINGSLDLERVSYSYDSWLKKEAGQVNSLGIKARLLNWKTPKLERLIYSLGSSQLLVEVAELKPLKLTLKTDGFDMQGLKAVLPDFLPPDAKGLIVARAEVSQAGEAMRIGGQVSIREGQLRLAEYPAGLEGISRLRFNILARPDGLQIGGEADLTQAAYSYKDWLNKPRGLKNSVIFQGVLKETGGLWLERSLILLDSSKVSLKGWIRDTKSSESELNLSGEGIEVDQLTPVFGNLLPDKLNLAGGRLKLTLTLTGQLNGPDIQGVAEVSGVNLSGMDHPFRLDNLSARLNRLDAPLKSLDLQAPQGSYQRFGFSQLLSRVRFDKSQLLIDKLSLSAYHGNLSLTGRVNLSPAPFGYELSFEADKMEVAQLARELGLTKKGVISGRLRARGQLSNEAKGDNKFAGLNGKVSLELTNGEIKKYSALAKIFSLISPSIFLNGRLPDLSRQGFVYQSIQGSFNIIDGVATTDDLALASDAWRIVTTGKIDMVNQQLDLKVCVQPWQTLDKLVSHIPIAGKILTGEKGGLIYTYFTVKGGFASPEVTAKPIASLAENIWGIFKRTITLPLTILPE